MLRYYPEGHKHNSIEIGHTTLIGTKVSNLT